MTVAASHLARNDCPVCGKVQPPASCVIWWDRFWHHECADGMDQHEAYRLAKTDWQKEEAK